MKRFISLLLVIIMLASMLVGCANGGGGADALTEGVKSEDTSAEASAQTSADTSAETSEETSEETSAETTEETSADTSAETSEDTSAQTTDSDTSSDTASGYEMADGVIFENRKTEYTIVYALYSGIAAQDAVSNLINVFKTKCNVTIDSKKENGYNMLHPGMTGKKIVVGYVEKDDTAMEIYNSLHTKNSYIIKFVDNSLYLVGGSGEATAEAVDYFINNYIKNQIIAEKLVLEEGVIKEKNTPPVVPGLTIAGNSLDKYVIVHDGSAVGARFARELNSMLSEKTGLTFQVKSQNDTSGDYEILVGKTDREESQNIRADYDRPNVYYDVKVVGNKLVCMGEGWYTLGKVVEQLGVYLDGMESENPNLTGEVLSGDMIDEIDTTDMLNMAEGTDVRVLNYNMYGTVYDYDTYTLFSGDTERGEVIGDIILAYYPDVVTTNEFYLNTALYKAVMGQISDYYTIVTSPYDEGYPFENSTGGGRGNPEQILIKKGSGIEVVVSGWRYLSEGDGEVVNFHGIHWAVLKNSEDKQFIISVGHYADSQTNDIYAREQQQAIAYAQAASGSSETLPAVAAGDFFSTATGGAAYKYHINTCGFTDPQRIKEINRNITERGDININQATSHKFGKGVGDGTRIDFIFHNSGFTPLKFKVLKSNELNYTSDHYPECVDLKLS